MSGSRIALRSSSVNSYCRAMSRCPDAAGSRTQAPIQLIDQLLHRRTGSSLQPAALVGVASSAARVSPAPAAAQTVDPAVPVESAGDVVVSLLGVRRMRCHQLQAFGSRLTTARRRSESICRRLITARDSRSGSIRDGGRKQESSSARAVTSREPECARARRIRHCCSVTPRSRKPGRNAA